VEKKFILMFAFFLSFFLSFFLLDRRALENKNTQFMIGFSEMEREHFHQMKRMGTPSPRTPSPLEEDDDEKEEEEEEEVVHVKARKRIIRRPVFQRSTDFFAFIRKPHRKDQLLSIEVCPFLSSFRINKSHFDTFLFLFLFLFLFCLDWTPIEICIANHFSSKS
jgi:hypothetical protein